MAFTLADIDSTWARVSSASVEEWQQIVEQARTGQPALAEFIEAERQSLGAYGQDLAWECAMVCFTLYRERDAVQRPATTDRVQAQWRQSQTRMAEAEALFRSGGLPEQLLSGSPEPQLFGAFVAAAMGPDPAGEETSPETLEDAEFWQVLAMLDALIVVLDAG